MYRVIQKVSRQILQLRSFIKILNDFRNFFTGTLSSKSTIKNDRQRVHEKTKTILAWEETEVTTLETHEILISL